MADASLATAFKSPTWWVRGLISPQQNEATVVVVVTEGFTAACSNDWIYCWFSNNFSTTLLSCGCRLWWKYIVSTLKYCKILSCKRTSACCVGLISKCSMASSIASCCSPKIVAVTTTWLDAAAVIGVVILVVVAVCRSVVESIPRNTTTSRMFSFALTSSASTLLCYVHSLIPRKV